MKNRHWLRSLLCLLLALCTVFALCGCLGGEIDPTPGPGPDEPDDPTPGPDDPTPGPDNPTPEKPVPDSYGNGAAVSGAGATLPENSTVLTGTTYDASTATDTKAATFFRSAREAGKVYRVSDDKAVTMKKSNGQTFDGKGAILIAPKGLVIEQCDNLTLCNLVLVGSITITGCNGVTLENVEIISDATALTLDSTSKALRMSDCRLTGKTAIDLAANDSVIINSYLAFTEMGIKDTALLGTTVQHCIMEGSGTAIYSKASDAAYRNLSISMQAGDTGIVLDGDKTTTNTLDPDVLNNLVALNVITGAQKSISLCGVKNVSVILNSVVSIEANDNRNIYICDNQMGGRLTANNNNYFLADGNGVPEDEYTHETVQTGNTNHNGDSLMDVDARLEVGADENLLPHLDKDLFVGMARKDKVKDLFDVESYPANAYITEHCKTDDYIILAPGAYAVNGGMVFNASHNNSIIYGYGAYLERQEGLAAYMNYSNTENIQIKGLTIGYKQQSCGQVYVLDKLDPEYGEYYVRVVTGAGMMNEFGNTNAKYYDVTGMGAQRQGTFYAYCDTGFNSILKENKLDCGVSTMKMHVTPSVYEMLREGDILTCRAIGGGTTISIGAGCKDTVFKDFNIYGNASGFAYVENDAETATTYYRVCDTTQNGIEITEDLYDKYRALEEKYGVSLEVSVDEHGRFRGSPAHIGSIDATHTTRCGEGSQVTSCIFENMCDDATNQNATHGRLAGWTDNGDGTTTLIYKGNFSTYSYSYHGKPGTPAGFCANFDVGDRVFVYTAAGQLVCDTEALSVTTSLGKVSFNWKDHGWKENLMSTVEHRSVTVKTDDVNFKALEGYNLEDNNWGDKHKVLIDNMSQSSNNFKFDNSLFRNIRSRGLLIKASGGTIVNCTFNHIGMSCAAILYEIYWGESGVTENMLVDRNLMDHTGYFNNIDRYAAVAIEGLGASVQEDFLLYKNITISNNHIINRTSTYAFYINSAKDVQIINNVVGPYAGKDFVHPDSCEGPDSADDPRPVIHINGAMNVKIEGNTYPYPDVYIEDYIVAEHNKNVYGKDVEFDGMPIIPDRD